MHFYSLAIALTLFSGLTMAAPSRGPAVEDFVGIEVEEVRPKSEGDEVLFNLENDVSKIETVQNNGPKKASAATSDASSPFNITTLMGLLVVLALPFISWMLVMNHLRKKATAESASNIEVLQKYRQDRVQARTTDKDKDKTDRKVS